MGSLVQIAVMPTVHFTGQSILAAVHSSFPRSGLNPCPSYHLFLHLHVNVAGNDRLMTAFDIILWHKPLIHDPFLCLIIRCYRFLKQCIAYILLILQDLLQRTGQPAFASRCSLDAVRRQSLPDLIVTLSFEVFSENAFYDLRFSRINDELSLFILIIPQEVVLGFQCYLSDYLAACSPGSF